MTVGTPPDVDLDAQPIDQLTVNTIRVLAMDAVQAANSGHPGTPMALAPVGYTLWTRYPAVRPGAAGVGQPRPLRALRRARLDPALRAAAPVRGQVGQPGLRDRGHARGLARRPEAVPPARLEVSRAPRVPLDLRGRVHHRPARHRDRDQRRHGDRRALAGRHVQPPGLRPVRLRRLRRRRRRLPDGGHRRRGRLAGRAPEAVEPVLVLRQQPDHHRGQHEPGVQRGRAGPVRRAGLGRAARHRRQRPRRPGRGDRGLQGRDVAADVDRGRQRHRLRRPAQAGHPRRARRAARGRRGRGDQAVLPLARRPGLPRPGPGPRALRRRHARQRRPGAPRVGGAVRPLRRRAPRPRRPAQPHAAPHAARRLGRRPAGVPGRRQGPGRARLQRQGAQRGRGAGAVDDRRILGPGAVEQVSADLRRRGRLQRRRPGRAQPALRGPRARRRRGLQRARPVQAARLPGRVPHLLRLPARRAAALGADGAAADPHLHPRLDRRRRGRAHPPAHRARWPRSAPCPA